MNIYIYNNNNIYLRTLHAHLHTTPADTVHTPHTDEWLVASKIVSIICRFLLVYFSKTWKFQPGWLFFFFVFFISCFTALLLFMTMLPLVQF